MILSPHLDKIISIINRNNRPVALFHKPEPMKTKQLFLLGVAITIIPLMIYAALVIMHIAQNPTWETVSDYVVTLPLSLATICYALEKVAEVVKELKCADNK